MSSPEQKPNKVTVAEVMQKDDSNCSAGTEADSEQNDQDIFVSQHSIKPNVIGFAFSVAPENEESAQPISDKSPIEIPREKFQRDAEGFLVLTPDIDLDG